MLSLRVNRKAYNVDVEPETPLLWVIRDTIGLTGTKFGCGGAFCGVHRACERETRSILRHIQATTWLENHFLPVLFPFQTLRKIGIRPPEFSTEQSLGL
jgi:hypothetical protein